MNDSNKDSAIPDQAAPFVCASSIWQRVTIAIKARRENAFFRHVVVLMSGSAIAQILPILISPLLSRIFSPEDIGVWGIYSAVVSIGALFVTLRYDSAILLPDEDSDAANIALFGLAISFIFSVIFFALLALGNHSLLLDFMGIPAVIPVWQYIPIGIFLAAAISIFSNWFIRTIRFSSLAFSRIVQSASTAIIQIGASVLKADAMALVAGQVMGLVLGIASFAVNIWRKDRHNKIDISLSRMKSAIIRYYRFPLFSLPAGLLNSFGAYLPLFMLGSVFSPVIAGYFALTQKVLAAPVALIGNNILDVFRERATTDYRDTGNCRAIFVKTLIALILLATPPSLILFFFAPSLFDFVFGNDWRESGEYARILAPMLLTRFVATPLGFVLTIAHKQNIDLFWQIGFFIVTFSTIYIGAQYQSEKIGIALMSIGISSMYVVYIWLSYLHARGITKKEQTS